MTRHVYPKEQVAHLWAQNAPDAPEIRTPTGNLYTENVSMYDTHGRSRRDSAIWSYGRHYCLARHARDRNGAPVVLFNENGYSSTTQSQRSIVWRALPPAAYAGGLFHVARPQASNKREHLENLADYRARYETEIKNAAKPRIRADTRAAYVSKAERIREEANRYAFAFKLGRQRITATTPEGIADRVKREEAKAAKLRAIAAEKMRVENAARLAEYLDAVAEWRNGDRTTDALPRVYDAPIALRLINGRVDAMRPEDRGQQVETTRGAHFPADDARKLWPLILAAKINAREFVPGGLRCVKLGAFPLSSITAAGDVIAGCHTVPFDESESLAEALGLI